MTFVCDVIIKVSFKVSFLHLYVLRFCARYFFRFQVYCLSRIK